MTGDFSSYLLSFIYIGIYWNNHHHLFQAVEKIRGGVLWANLHLLFWLSIVPFTTVWMGESKFSTWPVVFYGLNLFLSSIAYLILVKTLLGAHDKNSDLAVALESDTKGKISTAIYAVGIPLAFVAAWIACALYVLVAVMWLVPDRRIENVLIARE